MLLWGWLPPTLVMVPGFITVRFTGPAYMLLALPRKLPMGLALVFTTADCTCTRCVWVGSCAWATVTDVLPAASPRSCAPLKWMGTRPRRLGSANVVWPLPP